MYHLRDQLHLFPVQSNKQVGHRVSAVIIFHEGRESSVITTLSFVLSQNYSDLEIIVVGSGIPTFEFPDALCDKLVFFGLDENLGASYARNKGASEATGEYLWFVDSDIIEISPNCLTEATKVLSSNPEAACVGGVIFDDLFVVGRKWLSVESAEKVLEDDFVNTACIVVRTSAFNAIGGFTDFVEYPFDDVELGYKFRRFRFSCLGYLASAGRHPIHHGATRLSHECMVFNNLLVHLFINYSFGEFFNLVFSKAKSKSGLAAPNVGNAKVRLIRRCKSLLAFMLASIYLLFNGATLLKRRSERQALYKEHEMKQDSGKPYVS